MIEQLDLRGPDAPEPRQVEADVRRALDEDIGPGDASGSLVDPALRACARIVCRESAVLAGMPWARACFLALDPGCRFVLARQDGARLQPGDTVLRIEGQARALLAAERSALNFLQLLSGTATTTAAWVQRLAGSRTRLLDTRKTLPGLRIAQKYAVRCGGGLNHRLGLYDAILLKENHIAACGSIAAAVAAARRQYPSLSVEVEVENEHELGQAIEARPDRVMLDDYPRPRLAAAVAALRAAGIESEVSGGLDERALEAVLACGVDFISVGALTKHLRAIDLSMRIEGPTAPG